MTYILCFTSKVFKTLAQITKAGFHNDLAQIIAESNKAYPAHFTSIVVRFEVFTITLPEIYPWYA